jgi:hypothetical protein
VPRITVLLGLAVDYAKIVVRVLVVVLLHDAITRSVRITSHGQILFVNLMGVAANTNARSVAVKRLMSLGDISSSGVPTARALRILTLSHMIPRIDVLSRRCTSTFTQQSPRTDCHLLVRDRAERPDTFSSISALANPNISRRNADFQGFF